MNRIKQLRKEKKLSQKELAQIIGANASSVCSWEKGVYNPNATQAIKLSNFFDCNVDYILGYTDINSKVPKGEDNTITVYGRGMGMKKYKVSKKKLAAIKALLDDDDDSDDLDF